MFNCHLVVTDGKRLRVAQVRAWRSRGKVPLGVDATASIVEACALDRQLSTAAATAGGSAGAAAAAAASEHVLRMQYALPIVR